MCIPQLMLVRFSSGPASICDKKTTPCRLPESYELFRFYEAGARRTKWRLPTTTDVNNTRNELFRRN